MTASCFEVGALGVMAFSALFRDVPRMPRNAPPLRHVALLVRGPGRRGGSRLCGAPLQKRCTASGHDTSFQNEYVSASPCSVRLKSNRDGTSDMNETDLRRPNMAFELVLLLLLATLVGRFLHLHQARRRHHRADHPDRGAHGDGGFVAAGSSCGRAASGCPGILRPGGDFCFRPASTA